MLTDQEILDILNPGLRVYGIQLTVEDLQPYHNEQSLDDEWWFIEGEELMKLQDRSEVAKYCPNCAPARKLIVRTNRQNGTQFLGCPNWPVCDYTEPIPEHVKMEAAGATRLPGFEGM